MDLDVWGAIDPCGIHCVLPIPRNEVQKLMKKLDPEGCDLRRRRKLRRREYASPGPNFAWHVDRYDKLKTMGFPFTEQ